MLAHFTVVPLDCGESVGELVAKMIELIDKSGLQYQVTSMGTIIEGDSADVFALIQDCHNWMRKHSRRVSTHIAVDDREGATGRLKGKVQRIEAVLAHEVCK